ncbi:hypothetical protein 2 [Wenling crustacean virus 5]|uniref:hypothetical protein 2 n=1 Tax=Wenling crustacean virus 5 TaxID=1923488 RepID=UPI00090B3C28|nr:hypothetical protein 2 [Wenling crustacean virus 5]APG78488.1 hypothetical protein 2 [Wenling crustacean virus 5]
MILKMNHFFDVFNGSPTRPSRNARHTQCYACDSTAIAEHREIDIDCDCVACLSKSFDIFHSVECQRITRPPPLLTPCELCDIIHETRTCPIYVPDCPQCHYCGEFTMKSCAIEKAMISYKPNGSVMDVHPWAFLQLEPLEYLKDEELDFKIENDQQWPCSCCDESSMTKIQVFDKQSTLPLFTYEYCFHCSIPHIIDVRVTDVGRLPYEIVVALSDNYFEVGTKQDWYSGHTLHQMILQSPFLLRKSFILDFLLTSVSRKTLSSLILARHNISSISKEHVLNFALNLFANGNQRHKILAYDWVHGSFYPVGSPQFDVIDELVHLSRKKHSYFFDLCKIIASKLSYDEFKSLFVFEQQEGIDEEEAAKSTEQRPMEAEPITKTKPTKTFQNSGHELIVSKEGANFEQAIDSVEANVGINSSRLTSQVMTPSGEKTVIHMSDELIDNMFCDYIPSVSLPEIGKVWGVANSSTVNGVTTITEHFSDRTKYLMNMFRHYTTLVCWKIIAKPPLFQSQRFWVGFNPDGLPISEPRNLAGFEWNPSENNEIYVLTPWTYYSYNRATDDPLPDQVVISELSDLISAPDLATPLEISAYCTPVNMKLYVPKVVVGSTLQPCSMNSLAKDLDISQSSYKITVSDPDSPYYVMLDITADLDAFVDAVVHLRNDNSVIKLFAALMNLEIESRYALCWGDSTIDYILSSISSIRVNIIHDSANNVEITPVQPERIIPSKFTPEYFKEYDFKVKPKKSLRVLVDEPKDESRYEQQMFEYSYNSSSETAEEDQGATGDHTRRVDTHWSLIDKHNFSSTSDSYVFNIYDPLVKMCEKDRKRHLFFSHTPIIKVNSASIPASTSLFRITQYPESTLTLQQALQLPGVEYDPKQGELCLHPYWQNSLPVDSGVVPQPLYLHFHVLSGSFSVPINIQLFQNASSYKYHHLIADPQTEVFEQQEGNYMQTSTTEQRSSDDNVTDSERRWTYVHSMQFSPDVGILKIPINNTLMGRWTNMHAGRYHRWRGNLKLKFMINNSTWVNGNYHIMQSNFDLPAGEYSKPDFMLQHTAYGVSGAPGAPILVDVLWRSPNRWEPVISSNTETRLGYLYVVIPVITCPSATFNPTTQLTIYCDPSDVEFTNAKDPVDDENGWMGLNVTEYLRQSTKTSEDSLC